MPRVDGVAATATLHGVRPPVEVVAFTSTDDPVIVSGLLAGGATRHFDKTQIDELTEYVKVCARRAGGYKLWLRVVERLNDVQGACDTDDLEDEARGRVRRDDDGHLPVFAEPLVRMDERGQRRRVDERHAAQVQHEAARAPSRYRRQPFAEGRHRRDV